MFSAYYKLDNLCVIADGNGLQIRSHPSAVFLPYCPTCIVLLQN